ncbi:flavodoxin-dependent (E)-4-hydroxy-3-methylbut-2-enyl-diphosphate synthase [bacterium]|nr:flavodoxin-dependent (E)-4-hydroxy-3-methylbut-2-enyl-diphosphate synthase [candidate division CSSED10-310 bacterium]
MKRLLLAESTERNKVSIGGVVIGGGMRPVVQSMTNTDTRNVVATLEQINTAARAGARLMRVAVPDHEASRALKEIVKEAPVPVIADIHFDYQLALESIEAGVHKIRINPGNIGRSERIREIVRAAQDRRIPIRVGVNAGSLESDLLDKYGHPCSEALVESAMRNIACLEDEGFQDIVLSIKGSDVPMTVEAYRLIARKCLYPLHIGITEAGTRWTGAIRSSIGIGILLALGIGDTLRVSLAADPVDEVRVAYRILDSLGIEKHGPTVIACPTCGRTRINVIALAEQVENALADHPAPLTVAVMGCAVNGPGEAREADCGIAGGDGEGLLFRKGKIVRKVPESRIVDELVALFYEIAEELRGEGSEGKGYRNKSDDKNNDG